MADDTQALTQQPKAFTLPAPPELKGLNTNVGGVQGVPAPDYAADRAKFKTSADVSKAEAGLLQRQDQLNKEIGTAQQAEKQYLADAKASIASQMREQSQQIEAGLDETRKKFPYPEFHPTKDNIQDIATLFSVIGLIGVAMGGGGKQSALLSLNAMSGMMKGWQAGRADLWKKEKEEFDKQMQRTKAILEDAYRDADRAYKTLAYNREEANALAEQSAAKLGGQVGKQILEKQGVENYFKFLDGVKKDMIHAEQLADKRQQHKEDLAFRREEAKRREENAERRHKESMQLQRDKMAAKGTRGGAAQETALRVMQQDIGNAIYNLEDLKSEGEKKKKLPGGSVAFAQKFTGDISSMLMRYAANQSIDEGLQASDALMLNLAFDIASAQSGGRGQLSDAKVRAVVSQMPLDEQPEETKRTKWAALMTRVKEANKSMPEDKRIEIPPSLEKYFMGNRYKEEGGGVERGSDDKGKFHWEYNADRTQRRKVYD